jgi:hypothetical protein
LSLKTGISTELSGGYRAGYERGYQHGYQDAVSGLGYENVAEFHGAEAYGPYGEGMHEEEHAGYNILDLRVARVVLATSRYDRPSQHRTLLRVGIGDHLGVTYLLCDFVRLLKSHC